MCVCVCVCVCACNAALTTQRLPYPMPPLEPPADTGRPLPFSSATSPTANPHTTRGDQLCLDSAPFAAHTTRRPMCACTYVAENLCLRAAGCLLAHTQHTHNTHTHTHTHTQLCITATFVPSYPPPPTQPPLPSLEGSYDHARVSEGLYRWWVDSGTFTPSAKDLDPAKGSFTMMLPPPNVTGALHIGHALTAAIEDSVTRWYPPPPVLPLPPPLAPAAAAAAAATATAAVAAMHDTAARTLAKGFAGHVSPCLIL